MTDRESMPYDIVIVSLDVWANQAKRERYGLDDAFAS